MTTTEELTGNLLKALPAIDPVVTDIMRKFHRAGFAICLTGGATRDAALGKPIADIDLVVNQNPISLAKSFAREADMACVVLDDKRKIVRLVGKVAPSINIDIAMAQGGSIETDLACRDFTINAIAARWVDDGIEIIDPFNGVDDLNAKILRPVSKSSLSGDPVRIVRAYRFLLAYNLKADSSLSSQIAESRDMLNDVPGERITAELAHLFRHPASIEAIRKMADDRVLDVIFPELGQARGVTQNRWHHLDVFDHTLETFARLENFVHEVPSWLSDWEDSIMKSLFEEVSSGFNRLMIIKLAALYHDTGKPACRNVSGDGKVTFYGHEKAGEKLAIKIASRLKFSNTIRQGLSLLVRHHLRPFNAISDGSISRRSIYRFCRDLGQYTTPAMILAIADAGATRGPAVTEQRRELEKNAVVEILRYLDTLKVNAPVTPVDGNDIMRRFNLPAGPVIGKLLGEIKEAVAVGYVKNREEAFRYAETILTVKNKTQ